MNSAREQVPERYRESSTMGKRHDSASLAYSQQNNSVNNNPASVYNSNCNQSVSQALRMMQKDVIINPPAIQSGKVRPSYVSYVEQQQQRSQNMGSKEERWV